MPFNGSGVFSATASSFNPAVAGTEISHTDWNALLAELIAGLTATICKNGESTTSAAITFAAGVKFPATQNPSGDANVLDDYEEGTWTPTLGDGTNTYTVSIVSSKYTKVGNRVHIDVEISWTSIGSVGANGLRFSALPFTAGQSATIPLGYANGLDYTATPFPIGTYISNTNIFFYRFADNGAAASLAANSSSATGLVILAGTYGV